MIEVVGREMVIPREEFNIGTNYDTHSDVRIFHLKRVTGSGIDLSNLTFVLDLKYANNKVDAVELVKEVTDKDIYLTVNIVSTMLQVPGTVLGQIRAFNKDGNVKWTSYYGAFFVEDAINTPANYEGKLTEMEQLEKQFEEAIAKLTVLEKLKDWYDGNIESLKTMSLTATSYSVGEGLNDDGTPFREGQEQDNAKFYATKSAEKAAEATSKVESFINTSGLAWLYIDENGILTLEAANDTVVDFRIVDHKDLEVIYG